MTVCQYVFSKKIKFFRKRKWYMLQKNRGESEILEMKKSPKIRACEFPRGHYI